MADTSTNGKHDVWTHRIMISGLTVSVILTIVAIAWLECTGHEVPPSLPAIGGTALGALTGMLAAIMGGREP